MLCFFVGSLLCALQQIHMWNCLTTTDCWNQRNRQTKREKKLYMPQCNKYKLMALNYTEADSPTNLTINNACALLIFLMIIYSSSSSIATRCLCISAWMRVCVLRIRIALVIMRCLKTVLIKIKEKDKWSCARPAYTLCMRTIFMRCYSMLNWNWCKTILSHITNDKRIISQLICCTS